jgi:hypothetical protein
VFRTQEWSNLSKGRRFAPALDYAFGWLFGWLFDGMQCTFALKMTIAAFAEKLEKHLMQLISVRPTNNLVP